MDGTRERSHRPVSLANLCQAFSSFVSSEASEGERETERHNFVSTTQHAYIHRESELYRCRPYTKDGDQATSPKRLSDEKHILSSSDLPRPPLRIFVEIRWSCWLTTWPACRFTYYFQ